MKKLKWVYVCDICGEVARPEVYCFMGDFWTGPPRDWEQVIGKDLCPVCYRAYSNLERLRNDDDR